MQTGYLVVETYPAGAKVYIDDILVLDEKGKPILSPVVLVLLAGYHNMRLELEGYCNEFDGRYIMENETVNTHHNFNIC